MQNSTMIQVSQGMKAAFSNWLITLSFGVCLLGFASAGIAGQINNELKEINQLSEQGNQAAALDRVNSFIANNPKNAEALFMRGVILVELGKRDEAIKSFTELTEKFPSLPEPYNNLAVLYADQGQYDKARKALESAIKTHPSYATAHENLGDIYARLASEAYDKALKLDTSNTRAQNKLSMITDLFSGGKRPLNKPAAAPATSNTSATNTSTSNTTASNTTASNATVGNANTSPAAPAASTASAPPATDSKKPVADNKPADDQQQAIVDAVNAWADAWSDKNIDRYLESYASDFKTPGGESRKQWESVRRERVGKPGKISVKLSNIQVAMEGDSSAKVVFRQGYKASGMDTSSNKTLNLVKEGNRWLIKQERVGKH